MPTFCSAESPVLNDPGVTHALKRPAQVGGFKLQPDSEQTRSARASIVKGVQGTAARVVSVDKYVAEGAIVVVSVIDGLPGEYYKARSNFLCGSAVGDSAETSADLSSATAVTVPGLADPVVCFAPYKANGLTRTQCGWFDDHAVSITLLGTRTSQAQPFSAAYRKSAEG